MSDSTTTTTTTNPHIYLINYRPEGVKYYYIGRKSENDEKKKDFLENKQNLVQQRFYSFFFLYPTHNFSDRRPGVDLLVMRTKSVQSENGELVIEVWILFIFSPAQTRGSFSFRFRMSNLINPIITSLFWSHRTKSGAAFEIWLKSLFCCHHVV